MSDYFICLFNGITAFMNRIKNYKKNEKTILCEATIRSTFFYIAICANQLFISFSIHSLK